MRIDRIVLNASPLICLFKSGLEEILPAMFDEIVVPEAVYREVAGRGKIDSATRTMASKNWIHRVAEAAIDPLVAAWDLGQGESAVMSFALKNSQFWAILDDREARRCALSLRCRTMGTVGIVILAKRRGIVPAVRTSLEQLKNSGLWLDDDFIRGVCRLTGEE